MFTVHIRLTRSRTHVGIKIKILYVQKQFSTSNTTSFDFQIPKFHMNPAS